ncbi:MAG: protein kinase, partial [Gemmatimonadota bacterium]|nr:protein kinase [Gemmatimonadota bacterium]
EITTTANLQHPHILPLFDSGEADSFLFYVMPYVEGETVRDRISREKQLPVADAVRIASEVAAALDYAHRHGVIHRDIKPENILLHDGSALVADFGIALAASKAGGTRMTETGMSLGTPHYMSPEQAMGEREITARSDVYALGAVLYEMLTGDPPFTGSTAQAIVARVVTEHPRSMTSQRHTIPPQVEAAVLTSLEKLPADRFATAAEFAAALADPTYASRTTVMMAAQGGRKRSPITLALAGVAAVATIAALWGWLRPAPPRPTLRYTMMLPEGRGLSPERGTRFALSPDGSKIVYAGQGPDGTQLYLLDRSQLEPRPLPGTDGAIVPFFSPDGEQVGFNILGNAALKVVALNGAPPVTIADSGLGSDGATWSADGYIYFDGLTGGGTTGLVRVAAAGGPHEQVTVVDTAQGQQDHFWPVAIPGGRGVFFTVQYRNSRQASNIAVYDQKSGTYHTLVQGLTARYAPTGHMVYVSSAGDLLAVPFDLESLQITGQPVAITPGVAGRAFGAVDLALSTSGTLIYQLGTVNTDPGNVVYVTRDGRATPMDAAWSGTFQTLALSPDGRQLAVSIISGGEQQTWIKQLPDGPLSKLTFDGALNYRPAWNSDGLTVGFSTAATTFAETRADGSSQPRVALSDSAGNGIQEAFWSRDGRWLVYRTTSRDIFARRTSGDTTPVPLLVTPGFQEIEPTLSPDGRWLAYASNESGRFEVYVRPFPDTDRAKWQVSTDGAADPLWSHSGRELFFNSNAAAVIAVEVLPGTTFTMGKRTTLFSASQSASGPRSWDITPDDQRFVMIQLAGNEGTQNRELLVVENFFPELQSSKQP